MQSVKTRTASIRNPLQTRSIILETAMEEVHIHGFHATSLNQILKKTNLTKGAFYHHFQTKAKLGEALISEALHELVQERWVLPLQNSHDPLQHLLDLLQKYKQEEEQTSLQYGCPLNNLAQELSGTSEVFREHLKAVFDSWVEGFTTAFELGKQKGTVRKDIDSKAVAFFIISNMEGCIGLVKTYRSLSPFEHILPALTLFLQNLRPENLDAKPRS